MLAILKKVVDNIYFHNLVGTPGGGKDVTGKVLCAILPHPEMTCRLVMSEVIDRHKTKGDDLARQLLAEADKRKKGLLMSNEPAMEAFARRVLSEYDRGCRIFILDGVTRNLLQAQAYTDIKPHQFTHYLELADQGLAIQRILERGKTSGREDDSDPKIVADRLQVFAQETMPAVNWLRDYNPKQFRATDASQPPHKIIRNVLRGFGYDPRVIRRMCQKLHDPQHPAYQILQKELGKAAHASTSTVHPSLAITPDSIVAFQGTRETRPSPMVLSTL